MLTSSASAISRPANASGISSPSYSQRFGYSAAMPPAMIPARQPASSTPINATTGTTAAPISAVTTRCASKLRAPSFDAAASTATRSGG